MMIFERMFEKFCFIEKTHTPDGEGGYITSFLDGYEFLGVATLDTTLQARIAEKEGLNNVYTIATARKIKLVYGDIVKRKSDGQYFKVTSNGAEKSSPEFSSIDIAYVTAERWQLHD